MGVCPQRRRFLACRFKAILVGLALVVACKEERAEEQTNPSAAATSVASTSASPRGANRPSTPAPTAAGEQKTSWLIVIGSWKLAKGQDPPLLPPEQPQDVPQSVQVSSGFPRAAQGDELRSLRPGYGAQLLGICSERSAAERALAALKEEGVSAYLKQSKGSLVDACPVVDHSFELGAKLVRVIEEQKPNSTQEVERLLQMGAPVDHGSGSGTPINLAAYNNDLDVVRLLVAAGARVNITGRAPQEESTLELALRTPYGDPLKLVRFLVDHGANVDAETLGAEADPGSTPALIAARHCDAKSLAFLLSKTKQRPKVDGEEVCSRRRSGEDSESARAAVQALLTAP